MAPHNDWLQFCKHFCWDETLGFGLDVSRMPVTEEALDRLTPAMARALDEMAALEAGATANPDEGRRVGHYWLRAPERCPDEATARAIRDALDRIRRFAADVHAGVLRGGRGEPFRHGLLIGIGGSALGPQLLADALGTASDRMTWHFLDNTDPDGFARVLNPLGPDLARTLTLVVSKSGATPETRNGMLAAARAYERAGLAFPPHAAAITGAGGALDARARSEGWLAVFPMWDWVGGRTSVTSAVGLLPAALQGIDIDALLDGARRMDEATRGGDPWRRNPAALLAAMWHIAGQGRGDKAMVVLPYKDRLLLLSRYLQQLVMESLGKRLDREGRVVHQGLTVYGNKGSTDQHAFVQQLRDGRNDFFAVFIEVLCDEAGSGIVDPVEVEPGVTAGDYLEGFLLGTRRALSEGGRASITITIRELTARTLGALIALFERAVGLYASLVNINAYHQPGVEAGKRAASDVLALQRRVLEAMAADGGSHTAEEWAAAAGAPDEAETAFKLLERLAVDPARRVERHPAADPRAIRYRLVR